MARRQQKFSLRPGKPVVIETPAGLVTISKGDGRHIVIELPEGMTAHLGEDRALRSALFLRKEEDGRIVPTYRALEPVVGKGGELIGVKPVGVRRVVQDVLTPRIRIVAASA